MSVRSAGGSSGDRSRQLGEGCGGPEPVLAATTSRILLFACDVDEGVGCRRLPEVVERPMVSSWA
jgi:hypothetical protein